MTDDLTTLPEWNTQLSLNISPAQVAHTAFYSARSVHTGWQSCIDPQFVLFELKAADACGNQARFVEQEYAADEEDEGDWHDWSVEICINNLYVTAHWQAPSDVGPADWDWCLQEAEKAFERVCLLLGKRVRKGLIVEEMEEDIGPALIGFDATGQEQPRRH